MDDTAPQTSAPDVTWVAVKGNFCISGADGWRQRFAVALEQSATVEVDLSGVEDCDAAGLQLLCSLHRTAAELGRKLELQSPAPAVESAANLIGLPLARFMQSTAASSDPTSGPHHDDF
jgi:ABC-type transporter Mla MlaB component